MRGQRLTRAQRAASPPARSPCEAHAPLPGPRPLRETEVDGHTGRDDPLACRCELPSRQSRNVLLPSEGLSGLRADVLCYTGFSLGHLLFLMMTKPQALSAGSSCVVCRVWTACVWAMCCF